MAQIEQALKRLYSKHRIVFWYDDKQELQTEFDALALPDVEKIVLDGNQFEDHRRHGQTDPRLGEAWQQGVVGNYHGQNRQLPTDN